MRITESDRNRLETEFVDNFGIGNTKDMLVDICYAKAEHIRTNWQDNDLAKQWERVAKQLDKLRLERIAGF
jgi:hypothetical protein